MFEVKRALAESRVDVGLHTVCILRRRSCNLHPKVKSKLAQNHGKSGVLLRERGQPSSESVDISVRLVVRAFSRVPGDGIVSSTHGAWMERAGLLPKMCGARSICGVSSDRGVHRGQT